MHHEPTSSFNFTALVQELKLELVNPTYSSVDVKVELPKIPPTCTHPEMILFCKNTYPGNRILHGEPGVEMFYDLKNHDKDSFTIRGLQRWSDIAVELKRTCADGSIDTWAAWTFTGRGREYFFRVDHVKLEVLEYLILELNMNLWFLEQDLDT